MNNLELVISNTSGYLTRRFSENGLRASAQFQALCVLLDNAKWVRALQNGRKESHPLITTSELRQEVKLLRSGLAFTMPQRLSWHLELPLRRAIQTRRAQSFVVNGASGFHGGFSKEMPAASQVFYRSDERTREQRTLHRRGFADTLLFLAPHFVPNDPPGDLQSWFGLLVSVEPTSQPGLEEHLDVQYHLLPQSGYLKYCIPHPNLLTCNETRYDRLKHLLVVSRNVREAVRHLAEAWHNPRLKSVLLSSPPGSGKEELKNALVSALAADVADFSCPALSGTSSAEAAIIDTLTRHALVDLNTNCLHRRTILFFDEVHHTSAANFRTELLRIMESGKLTSAQRDVNLDNAVFVLAASKPPELLATLQPPDLWTRIQHSIYQRHPLDLHMQERREALRAYCDMFWRRVHDAVAMRGVEPCMEMVHEHLGKQEFLDCIANAFVDAMDSPLVTLFSIRTLRSVVERLYSQCRHHLQINLATTTGEIEKALDFDARSRRPRLIGVWCTNLCSTVMRDHGVII